MKRVDRQQIIQKYSRHMKMPLSWLYYERVRYFEEGGEKQYEGIFHESIANSAEFFGVDKRQIYQARDELYRRGLGRSIPFSYQNDSTKDTVVFVSYRRLEALVAAEKLDPLLLEDLKKPSGEKQSVYKRTQSGYKRTDSV